MKKIRNLLINLLTTINVFYFKKKFKKIVFFHTPQSAGNSIHFFFKLNFGFRGFGLEDNDPSLDDKFYDKYLYLYGHFGLDKMKNIEFQKDYFYLFNIRDPKKRYLSNYYRNKDLSIKENQSYLSLESFLELRLSQNADNYYTRYLSGEIINNDNKKVDNEIFEKAIKNLKKINFFFVLEKSEVSFEELKKELNIKFPFSNFFKLHKNKVSGSTYPEISDKEKELLEELTFYDKQIYQKILQVISSKSSNFY